MQERDASDAADEQWREREDEVDEQVNRLLATGYTRDGVKWVHPTDRDIWYVFDPMTLEVIYSRKRAEQIGEELESRKRGGGL